MESTFQASQGDEFFDFDAASGEATKAMLHSSMAQAFEIGSPRWSEKLHDDATANNDYLQFGTRPNPTFQPSDNFVMGQSTEMGHNIILLTGTMTTAYNLPDHSSSWEYDSSLSQNNDIQFGDRESSVPAGSHIHLDFDPLTQTDLGSQGNIVNQQLQGGSSMDWVSPLDGPQPGLSPEVRDSVQLRRVIRCPWPSCVASGSLFHDKAEASDHFESHKNTILLGWKGPVKCNWPTCSSKVIFKYKYLLKTHLANIHVTPLRCSIASCSYTEPFGKQYDLDRHVSAVHGGSQYLCTVESCESSTIGFARKDKLVKHMREEHDNVRCSLNHCGSVIPDGEQEFHVQNFHGTYECALGACESGLPSYFSVDAARLHLISVHKVYRETAFNILRRCIGHTIREKDLRIQRQLVECQGCLELLPTAN